MRIERQREGINDSISEKKTPVDLVGFGSSVAARVVGRSIFAAQ
jgi:hypothetical protein